MKNLFKEDLHLKGRERNRWEQRLRNGTIFVVSSQQTQFRKSVVFPRRFAFLLPAFPALLALWLGGTGCRPAEQADRQPAPDLYPVVSSGTIGAGGAISDTFRRARINPGEAYQAERALSTLFRLRYARPEHRYEIRHSSVGALGRFIYRPETFEYMEVLRTSSGTFAAHRQTLPTEEETVGVQGKLKSSLWEAMTAQGVPPDVIWNFADIFGSRIDFLTEPRPDDAYRLVWTRRRHEQAVQEGNILFASYASGSRRLEVFAFRFGDDYFDQNGKSLRGQFLRAPLSYRRISSRFNRGRYHPILRIVRPHHGTDYSAPRGTPVESIGDGVVIKAGWDGGRGNAIHVRHAGSYTSVYGHLQGYARGARGGARVKQGQVIGYVGSTGLATGPHLHFEFHMNGRPVDFLRLRFESSARSVPDASREAFRDLKKRALTDLSELKTGFSHPEKLR